MRRRTLSKTYLAKVDGIFPEFFCFFTINFHFILSGQIVCDQPISVLSKATGIRCIKSDGQDALSRFWYFLIILIFKNLIF